MIILKNLAKKEFIKDDRLKIKYIKAKLYLYHFFYWCVIICNYIINLKIDLK